MPLTCGVCSSPAVLDIEAALRDGAPQRQVARQFGLSKDAVSRHVRNDHGGTAQVIPMAAKGALLSPDLGVRARALLAAADAAVREAERSAGSTNHLRALRGWRTTLRGSLWSRKRAYAEPVSEVQRASLEASWKRAVAAYQATEGRPGPRLVALEGLREALLALFRASPPAGGVWMSLDIVVPAAGRPDAECVMEGPPFVTADPEVIAAATSGKPIHIHWPGSGPD